MSCAQLRNSADSAVDELCSNNNVQVVDAILELEQFFALWDSVLVALPDPEDQLVDATLHILSGLQGATLHFHGGCDRHSLQLLTELITSLLSTKVNNAISQLENIHRCKIESSSLQALVLGWGYRQTNFLTAQSRTTPLLMGIVNHDGCAPKPLDSLVHIAAWQSNKYSEVYAHTSNRCADLAHALSRLPIKTLELSETGWATFLNLHTEMIAWVLTEAVHLVVSSKKDPQLSTVELLAENEGQHKSLHTALAAIATHPSLHCAARDTLHSWFVASGNIVVWELSMYLLEYCKTSIKFRKECMDTIIATLPCQLQSLYKSVQPQLLVLADVHTLPVTEDNLVRIMDSLRSIDTTQLVSTITEDIEMDIWRLLLDGSGWLKISLAIVQPLLQVATNAVQDGHHERKCARVNTGDTSSGTASDTDSGFGDMCAAFQEVLPGAEHQAAGGPSRKIDTNVKQAAAEYIGWILWPHQRTRRELLCTAVADTKTGNALKILSTSGTLQALDEWCFAVLRLEQSLLL